MATFQATTEPRTEAAAPAPWFARVSGRLSARPLPDAIDYGVAAACFAAFTLPVLAGWGSGTGSPLAVASFGVVAAVPLIVRRKWPVLVLAFVTAVYLAAAIAGTRFTPFVSNAGPNFAIAVFTVADRRDRQSSLLAVITACLATWGVFVLGRHFHPGQDQDAVQAIAAIPAWIAGDIVRVRRTYRQALASQLGRQAAERDRRVRAEERLRLSRDVHDVVSHSLSLIAVRSGVARLLLDDCPAEAAAALSAIETASRSALDDSGSYSARSESRPRMTSRSLLPSAISPRWCGGCARTAWTSVTGLPASSVTTAPRSNCRPTGSPRKR